MNVPLGSRGYSYRADGALTSIDEALAGPRTFTLDTGARVTSVEATNWSERYAYDEAGNQTSASWPTRHPGAESQGERSYQGTRITRAGSIRYEHDTLGRTVLRQKTRLSRKPDTWHYTWDAEDRMSGVATPDGTHWRYRYDALSRRTAKQRLTPTGEVVEETLFTWDGTTLCEESAGPVTLTWTHNGLHPLTQAEHVLGTTDDRFFAIVTDLIGTPRELVDESGDIAWRARSTLWGSTTWTRNATAYTPLRFPGQYFDPESGLHHNYFRTYDPETARYLTPDPLGLAPAPNPATYVHNPHTWSDPLGLAPKGCPELRPGYTSQPAFDDPYNPDVVDRRLNDMRDAYGIPREAAPPAPPSNMIGANGTRIFSSTLWEHGPFRIDVENPDPGGRMGQLHFQDVRNPEAKYQFNFETGEFSDLPRSIHRSVKDVPGYLAGIKKGLRYLGED